MAFGFRKTATAVVKPDRLLLLLLLLLLFNAVEFSPGDSSPYPSADKTNTE